MRLKITLRKGIGKRLNSKDDLHISQTISRRFKGLETAQEIYAKRVKIRREENVKSSYSR